MQGSFAFEVGGPWYILTNVREHLRFGCMTVDMVADLYR